MNLVSSIRDTVCQTITPYVGEIAACPQPSAGFFTQAYNTITSVGGLIAAQEPSNLEELQAATGSNAFHAAKALSVIVAATGLTNRQVGVGQVGRALAGTLLLGNTVLQGTDAILSAMNGNYTYAAARTAEALFSTMLAVYVGKKDAQRAIAAS